MAERQKKERKVIKIGTHGRTNTDTYKRDGQSFAVETIRPKATLQETDKQEWKARKAKRQLRKDQVRTQAKAKGHKMGRFVAGGALCKKGCPAVIRFDGMPSNDPRDATRVSCTGGGR